MELLLLTRRGRHAALPIAASQGQRKRKQAQWRLPCLRKRMLSPRGPFLHQLATPSVRRLWPAALRHKRPSRAAGWCGRGGLLAWRRCRAGRQVAGRRCGWASGWGAWSLLLTLRLLAKPVVRRPRPAAPRHELPPRAAGRSGLGGRRAGRRCCARGLAACKRGGWATGRTSGMMTRISGKQSPCHCLLLADSGRGADLEGSSLGVVPPGSRLSVHPWGGKN